MNFWVLAFFWVFFGYFFGNDEKQLLREEKYKNSWIGR